MVPCPECGKARLYKWKYLAFKVFLNKIRCKSCVHKGDKCYIYGKSLPSKTKEKIRRANLGLKRNDTQKSKISAAGKIRYLSPEARAATSKSVKKAMHRPEVRIKHLAALAETKYLGRKTDKGQLELLSKWNSLGFQFEPNFQVYAGLDLFYVDGYDKKRGVVLEYDAKYHLKPSQKTKDLIRQQKIINILKPKKFWRYDATNKQWKNVLEKVA